MISNKWEWSAKLITPFCILSTIFPTQPWIMARNDGALGEFEGISSLMNFTTFLPKNSLFLNLRGKFALKEGTNAMTQQRKREVVEILWEQIFTYGVIYFTSNESSLGFDVAHLNSLMVTRLGEEKYFIVVDPELKNNKFLTLDDTIEMIQNEKFNFSLYEF